MSQTHLLYQLQTLDSKVDHARRELAQVEARLGESEAFRSAKQSYEVAQTHLRQAQTALKDLELEVKNLNDKIANQEKLLYSGKGLSAKEAANLQDEVASLRRWQGNREEALLEAMVDVEEKETAVEQAQATLAETEINWQNEQAHLLERQAVLKTEIANLREQRPTIVDGLNADNLRDYEDLRRKKAGVAVAAVKDNTCQACGIMVSNSKLQRARADDIVYCGACGRILYVI